MTKFYYNETVCGNLFNRSIFWFVGSLVFQFSIQFKSFCILMQFEFCDISIQLSALRNLKFQTNDILVKNPSCSDEAQHRSDRVRKVFIMWPTRVLEKYLRDKLCWNLMKTNWKLPWWTLAISILTDTMDFRYLTVALLCGGHSTSFVMGSDWWIGYVGDNMMVTVLRFWW